MTHVYVEQQCYQYKQAKQNDKQKSKNNTGICKKAAPVSLIVTKPPIGKPTTTKPSWSTASLFKTVSVWMQRSHQRKQLAQLDKHLLDDIGLTKEMVAKEIAKPFWK